MAATVATPLERSLGRIAGVTEMTSSSSLGSTRVTLQFDLDRDIDGAARDVQAALNAARSLLPTGLPSNPTYRKVNPADAPIMILALTSDTMTQGQMYDAGSTIIAQKLSQVQGVGQVQRRRQLAAGGARRAQSARRSTSTASASRTCAPCSPPPTPTGRRASSRTAIGTGRSTPTTRPRRRPNIMPLIVAYRNGAAVAAHRRRRRSSTRCRTCATSGSSNGKPSVLIIINRQPNANIIETVDSVTAHAAAAARVDSRARSTSTS